jgi:hypothetical protein
MKTNSDTTAKLYIGFDVHKEKTAIALAEPGAGGNAMAACSGADNREA